MTKKKTKNLSELDDLLEEMAQDLADSVLHPQTDQELTVAEKTSAFKAMTNYYCIKHRLNPPNVGDDRFNGYAQQIASLGGRGGNATTPSGPAVGTDAADEAADLDF